MINVKFNSKQFAKDMKNIVEYSSGFIEGAHKGKRAMLENVGQEVLQGLKQFIDTNARVNPSALHHVYEWYQTGSPDARLFDINYVATQMGLSFNSTFRQSTSIKSGSKVPFYNKAQIMENGIPVTIRPVAAQALAFNDNGKMVFTKTPVTVTAPGGESASGSYGRVFDQFFSQYFSQSFLQSTGILNHLNNPEPFKSNLNRGKSGGRSAGISVGYNWITRRSGE
jgi:hypothetical protein